MKIIALKYGESIFGEHRIFKGGSQERMLPISFVIYLIQTENKNILVDAGCDDGAGFVMSVFKKPVEVLAEYGLSPDDITDVVVTHGHHDHVEAIGYYRNAEIHVQKEEYEKTARFLSEGRKVHLVEDEYVVADGVTMRKIGGHSAGSSIVLAGDYVLCGDECYYKECLSDHILTGSSCDEEKSLGFINVYSDNKYKPLLFHDPRILENEVGFVEIL
ncbi:MAG: MBL fold metallo-hydrolase [Clostridia bacterium]|nr:MBL fold metallo-hydrolase [Clostridia bacterium]